MDATNPPSAGGKPVARITLAHVLAWIFGILFLLAAVSALVGGALVSLVAYALAGFLLLPPLYARTFGAMANLSRGLRVAAAVVLAVVGGVAMLPGTPSNSGAGAPVGGAPAAPAQVAAEKSYQPVFTFKGNGTKKSEPFRITGDRFKVKYSCSGGLCSAFLYPVGSSLPKQLLVNTTDAVSDETIVYGAGEYYIDANVIGTFAFAVEDYR